MTNIVDANYYSKNSEFQKKIATELFRYHSFKSHNENILDTGCGDGAITELLSQHGTVTGIDSSKSMIEYATNNHLNTQVGKFLIIKHSNQTFFAILCPSNPYSYVHFMSKSLL